MARQGSAPERPKKNCTVRPAPPKKSCTVQPQGCKRRPHWKASRDLGGVFHWERERKEIAKMYIDMYDDQGRPICGDQSVGPTDTESSEQQQQQRPQLCQREKSDQQPMSSNTSSTTLVGSDRWSVTPSERTQHDQDEKLHETVEKELARQAAESSEMIQKREAMWCLLFSKPGHVVWDSTEPGQASFEVQRHTLSPKGSPYRELGSYFGEISWIPETHIPRSDSTPTSTQDIATLKPQRPQVLSRSSMLSMSFRRTQRPEVATAGSETTKYTSIWRRSTTKIALLRTRTEDGRSADLPK